VQDRATARPAGRETPTGLLSYTSLDAAGRWNRERGIRQKVENDDVAS
jgi:hypothetical protein